MAYAYRNPFIQTRVVFPRLSVLPRSSSLVYILSDSLTGSDSIILVITSQALADTGSFSENETIVTPILIELDSIAGTDLNSAIADPSILDSVLISDVITPVAVLYPIDTLGVNDSNDIPAGIATYSDSGLVDDSESIASVLATELDSITESDTEIAIGSVTETDSITESDNIVPVAVLYPIDTLGVTDSNSTTPISLVEADQVSETDSIQGTGTVTEEDQITESEDRLFTANISSPDDISLVETNFFAGTGLSDSIQSLQALDISGIINYQDLLSLIDSMSPFVTTPVISDTSTASDQETDQETSLGIHSQIDSITASDQDILPGITSSLLDQIVGADAQVLLASPIVLDDPVSILDGLHLVAVIPLLDTTQESEPPYPTISVVTSDTLSVSDLETAFGSAGSIDDLVQALDGSNLAALVLTQADVTVTAHEVFKRPFHLMLISSKILNASRADSPTPAPDIVPVPIPTPPADNLGTVTEGPLTISKRNPLLIRIL